VSLRLPPASGRQIVRLLELLEYQVIRQRGSHIRMRKATPLGQHSVTIPDHREVARGTLNDILNEVSLWNSIPKERLIEMLREL
jgi:predicted RNA binding protein YcfA (HicA-like mRNA interferase family)